MRANKMLLLGVFLLVNVLVVGAISSDALDSKDATKRVIIQFDVKQGAETDQELKRLGCTDTFVSQLIPIVAAKCPKNSINSIAKRKDVKSVRDETVYHALLDQSVPQINGTLARSTFGVNGSGVKVAVLDSGINASHQSLVGRVILEHDFTGSGTTDDIFDHGTPVACAIACVNDTYVGVAPGASLLNGKVINDAGQGGESNILAGIEWALDNGARVISMSIGAGVAECNGDDALSTAVNTAVTYRNAVIIIGAGNGDGNPGDANIWSPGCAENPITVGAVTKSNQMWSLSSRGPTDDGRVKPDIVAPGENIVSARNTFDFSTYSGTSMATPHVSGVAALMIEARSKLYPDEVKRIIRETATNLTFDILAQGYGLVNALEAVNKSYQVVDAANFSNLTPAYPVKPAINDDFVLNASVFNNGNTETNNTNITLTLPAGMVLVSGASTQNVGNIAPRTTGPANATWIVRITQKANQTLILNATGGPLPASLQKSFVIEPAYADFALGISYPSVPEVNTTFDLNATATNNGTADANGTNVTLTMPAGMTLVSGANPQSIGQVAPGATGIATWTVKVTQKANQTVTVNATSVQFEASAQGPFVVVPGYAKFAFDNVFPAQVNRNNIFIVNTTITNIGTIATDNTNATIILSEGFKFAPQEVASKLLGTIDAGAAKSTGWRVKAFKVGTWPLWINATSTNENATTTFNITVV